MKTPQQIRNEVEKEKKLTKEEKAYVVSALSFYIHEVTHDEEKGCAGLPEGKERTILLNVLEKLQ